MYLSMVDSNNLQNEVNTLLGDKTPPEFQSPVKPVTQISNQPQIIPAVEIQQTSSFVPPIQSNPQATYAQPHIIEENPVKRFNYSYIIGAVILISIGAVGLFSFRTEIVGPLTYADCLKQPGSSNVDLEPKYCVMPDGEVFFENLSIIKDNSGIEPTPFDQSIIPGIDGY